MKTCENCGSRVYSLGCVNCDEEAYIEDQDYRTERDYVKLADGTSAHRDDVKKNSEGQYVLRGE